MDVEAEVPADVRHTKNSLEQVAHHNILEVDASDRPGNVEYFRVLRQSIIICSEYSF